MRPAHALLVLVTLAGLVVAGLLVFGSARDGSARGARRDTRGETGDVARPYAASSASAEVPGQPLTSPAGPGDEPASPPASPEPAAAGPGAGTLHGRVVGAPPELLATLEVQATALDAREPARLARCDAEGRFVLAGLAEGATYQLRGVAAGRASFGGARTDVRTARAGPGEVELAWLPERALVFQVADARTGLALTDFEVRLGRGFARALLDAEGRVRRSFPDGRARWVAWAPEEAREPLELVVSARGYRELRVGELLAPVGGELDLGRLVLEPLPRLVVRVLDGTTQAPVEGALVTLAHATEAANPRNAQDFDPHAGRTDAAGRVLLTRLSGAQAVLRVQHTGHADLERPIALTLAEEQQESVTLSARP